MIILLIKRSRLVLTIRKPEKFVRFLNGQPFCYHSKTTPFDNRTQIDHLNTGIAQHLDVHCNWNPDKNLSFQMFGTISNLDRFSDAIWTLDHFTNGLSHSITGIHFIWILNLQYTSQSRISGFRMVSVSDTFCVRLSNG
jgi:hypothetical protein